MNPKYPIYIISKGRWENPLTAKALEKINVPYHIVVEKSEYENYAKVIDPKKIIVLPEDFRENPKYAIKDEFGYIGGGIPARNFVWEHSISKGYERHWIMDDNIKAFRKLHNGKRLYVGDGAIFRLAEEFTDRYENVLMSGLNYTFFVVDKNKKPITINTRIYSCILLSNKTAYRWRGRYNEDTDLSLRILKDGYCTILFSAFMCDKSRTMTMKGGNTDDLYKQDKKFDGRLEMAKSLQRQHPDVTTIKYKWGRWQHSVNYKPFQKNKLIKKKEIDYSKTAINLKLNQKNGNNG